MCVHLEQNTLNDTLSRCRDSCVICNIRELERSISAVMYISLGLVSFKVFHCCVEVEGNELARINKSRDFNRLDRSRFIDKKIDKNYLHLIPSVEMVPKKLYNKQRRIFGKRIFSPRILFYVRMDKSILRKKRLDFFSFFPPSLLHRNRKILIKFSPTIAMFTRIQLDKNREM